MANNGKLGEYIFAQRVGADGFKVEDVSGNSNYFAKDIDFLITNFATGNTRSFEVKWCEKIKHTGNLFLEIENPRSTQWNGEGWWKHTQADYLAYGDAINQVFYVFPLQALKERVSQLSMRLGRTWDNSVGWLCPLDKVKDLAIQI